MTKEIFPPVSNRPDFPGMENEIESYWKENKTFHQSIENRSSAKDFVFYDGPPFATGMPHHGHLLQGLHQVSIWHSYLMVVLCTLEH